LGEEAVVTVSGFEIGNFTLGFRVPSWCTDFVASVDSHTWKGKTDQYLLIKRTWQPGDKIRISFNVTIKVIPGGKSYPGQIAIKRGPQVLALDHFIDNHSVISQKSPAICNLYIATSSKRPAQWVGNSFFHLEYFSKMKNSAASQLTLVPYADAGQSGGSIKVWLPLNLKIKQQPQ
jgi:hypothetical protein